MSESGPVRESLERLLQRLAGEDAAGLLDEARTAARERVRAELTDELARRMLARIADEPAAGELRVATPAAAGEPADTAGSPRPGGEPAEAMTTTRPGADEPTETTEEPDRAGAVGIYVYAVIAPGRGAVGLTPGVAGGSVRILEAEPDGLRALVSDVPLDEFGDAALKRNLNDLEWVSATAVAHEAVVEAAMPDATLVPMRMCTIFLDEDAAREMLHREAAPLGDALARLRGAHEWGLKVIADRDAFAAAIAEEREAAAPARGGLGDRSGEGAGYFAALRLDRVVREEIAAELDRRTREIHESVAALSTDSRLRPPTSPELGGYEGDMVLNGAYLVPAARTEELRARAASLAERHAAAALTVELTGPWPPYNFSMLAGGL